MLLVITRESGTAVNFGLCTGNAVCIFRLIESLGPREKLFKSFPWGTPAYCA